MKKIKIFISYILLICLSAACSKWIDVKPSDRLAEDLLFENKEGFLKALNGIYVELANDNLYGKNLSSGLIDVMAQYYVITSSTHPYTNITTFDYTADNSKSSFESIWEKAYELIANCNVIIEKSRNSGEAALPDPYRDIVLGEALGLRAMFHLDMLRLYGPIYSETSKDIACMPYVNTAKIEVTPLLSAAKVLDAAIVDLQEASALLKEVDPILTEGVRSTGNSAGSNDLYYRQYRLNYFAIKALLARSYLWKGDKTTALQVAKEVINQGQDSDNPIFPFVTRDAATNTNKPDRLFSSEVIFAAYTINRVNMYKDLFSVEQEVSSRLSFNGGNTEDARVNELYDDQNDYRLRIWEDVTTTGKTLLTNQKYQDIEDIPSRYMMPLIRLSELYLIAAECEPDLERATDYLNSVRLNRNCVNLSPTDSQQLQQAIMKEFRKEVIGEGQMFFYYKRHAMESIPNHLALTGTKNIALGKYVVPLPDSETKQRFSTNKN